VSSNSSTAALRTDRYTHAAQALHWITAVLMFTLLPLAWVMANMPRIAANRELIYTLHKSLGLTVLALAVHAPWPSEKRYESIAVAAELNAIGIPAPVGFADIVERVKPAVVGVQVKIEGVTTIR
jgi:hypothetical protein